MTQTNSSVTSVARRGVPDYNWEMGTLTFPRNYKSVVNGVDEAQSEFSPFAGSGFNLKDGKLSLPKDPEQSP